MFLKIKMKARFPTFFSLRELRFIAPLQRSRQVTFMGKTSFVATKVQLA